MDHSPIGCNCGAYHRPQRERRGVLTYYSQGPTQYNYIGIDGEGQGRNPHRYVLLAYSDASGTIQDSVQSSKGLATEECLDLILTIPRSNTRVFAYAFNYDLTKILEDLPDAALHLLFRPELRQRAGKARVLGPRPISWRGYQINLQAGKFSVRKGPNITTIWDVWKFFQCPFTKALRTWGVGSESDLSLLERMKAQRSEFDKQSMADIKRYCFLECRYMAEVGERLVSAHDDAGLKLRTFYGPGSTASIILRKAEIHEAKRAPHADMAGAVSSSFFGGRFEHAVIGPVEGPIFAYDISSAYPYQLYHMPCLEHGRWRLTKNRGTYEKRQWQVALVHYRNLGSTSDHWSVLPFRDTDGSIFFPKLGNSGWIWDREYDQAAKLAELRFREAWVYQTDCDCRPFANIPSYYLARCRLGKDAKGIPLKLGPNSVYGKLAQSVGTNPPFQCWIWASLVTSMTRAMILEMMRLHKDLANLLAVATDGLYTRERLPRPLPLDTGTFGEDKPLGGWEEKVIPSGVFFARPGIYFPLELNESEEEEEKTFRARGVGRTVLIKQRDILLKAWEQGKREVEFQAVSRFRGAKTGITFSSKGYRRSPMLGCWEEKQVKLSLDPMPKRETIEGQRLTLRSVDPSRESLPYSRAFALSPEARSLRVAQIEAEEQPDGSEVEPYDE